MKHYSIITGPPATARARRDAGAARDMQFFDLCAPSRPWPMYPPCAGNHIGAKIHEDASNHIGRCRRSGARSRPARANCAFSKCSRCHVVFGGTVPCPGAALPVHDGTTHVASGKTAARLFELIGSRCHVPSLRSPRPGAPRSSSQGSSRRRARRLVADSVVSLS